MTRVLRRTLATVWLLLLLSPAVHALEKTATRIPDDLSREDWGRTNTVTLAYYNNCTGWIWVWSDFKPGERIGTRFDPGNFAGTVITTWHLVFSPAPSGYGFTGTIGIHPLDAQGCPTDPPLATSPFLPVISGWQAVAWGVPVPSSFGVQITASPTEGAPWAMVSDRPAVGPTGPVACGVCYPTTRATHSRVYGSAASPTCPGQDIFDGFCNAEWIMEAAMKYVVSVEDHSWGKVKALYR